MGKREKEKDKKNKEHGNKVGLNIPGIHPRFCTRAEAWKDLFSTDHAMTVIKPLIWTNIRINDKPFKSPLIQLNQSERNLEQVINTT